jgi:hypothetical protein
MYEKTDPWRRRSTTSLKGNGEKRYSVMKLTTPFVQSYMIATVSIVSREVASASAENL